MTNPDPTVPAEISRALLDAVRDLREWVAGPPAPDHEVQTYPICTPDSDFAGGVWCADDDCPLTAENSEIGDFRDGVFTLADVHAAIGEHIAKRRQFEEENGD